MFKKTTIVLLASLVLGFCALQLGAEEVDGVCLRACEAAYDACAQTCGPPPIDLNCISDCVDQLQACAATCIN